MTADPDTILAPLRALRRLLDEETVALRGFDVTAIAAIAEAKLELDGVLEATTATIEAGGTSPWTEGQRDELAELRQGIAVVGTANAHRLRVSWNTVRSLVEHVTGAQHKGYGRGPIGPTQAVLTADVG